METMIPFERALEIVLENAVLTGSQRISWQDSLYRILAEGIFSDMDMPPFDKSAVDGFACRKEDLHDTPLRITGTLPAGTPPTHSVQPGECIRIMTGAMVPKGADCVIMVELTEPAGEEKIRFTGTKTETNICYKGENIKTGEQVLEKGTRLLPPQIAVLASTGAVEPLVAKLPRVAVLSTGDELVEPWQKPSDARIRNSNSSQLMAQLATVPVRADYLGIAPDQEAALLTLLDLAFRDHDGVLLTGGVSMGNFDLVPGILEQAGVKILFKSVAIQPGRPTLFGTRGSRFVFGLPGNPVSSLVLFEMLVKPFLLRMMGHDLPSPSFTFTMGKTFHRKPSSRKTMIPVKVAGYQVFPVEYHGSAHINAYTLADGILTIAPGVTEIQTGELVNVRLL